MGEKEKPKGGFLTKPYRKLTPEGKRRRREFYDRWYIRVGQLEVLTLEKRGKGWNE